MPLPKQIQPCWKKSAAPTNNSSVSTPVFLRVALQIAESLRDYAFHGCRTEVPRHRASSGFRRFSWHHRSSCAATWHREFSHPGSPGSESPSHSRMAGRRRRGRYGWRLARKSIRVVGQNLFVVALFNTVRIILAVSEQLTASKSHHPVIGVICRTIDRSGTTQRCENGTVILSRASLAPRRIPTVMYARLCLSCGDIPFLLDRANCLSIRVRAASAAVPLHIPSAPPK